MSSDSELPANDDIVHRTKLALRSQRRFDPASLNFKTESEIANVLLYLGREWRKYSLEPLECLLVYLADHYDEVKEKIQNWLKAESSRMANSRNAPSSVYTLVGLSCAIIPENQELLAKVYLLLCESTKEKSSLRVSGTKKIRRAIRAPLVVQPSLTTIPFIGLVDPSILSDEQRSLLLSLYVSQIIPSKIRVLPHVLSALRPFLSTLKDSDIQDKLIPAFEKSLLRSPDLSLPTLIAFLSTTTSSSTAQLITLLVNSTKSSNPMVRSSCIAAFDSLPPTIKHGAIHEILVLPKSGKTASADHRSCLYSMLACIPPCSDIVQEALPLLAKETNDAVQDVLGKSLRSHLSHSLTDENVVSTLVKEMNTTKPNHRRIVVELIGSALWSSSSSSSSSSSQSSNVEKFIPPFENILKGVSSNPQFTNLSEGYVTLAILLKICDPTTLAKNPIVTTNLTSVSGKPHFLLNDKLFGKFVGDSVGGGEGEEWLIRALEGAFNWVVDDVGKNEHLRNLFANAFINLATNSVHHGTHASLLSTISRLALVHPMLVGQMVREGLCHYLGATTTTTAMTTHGHAPIKSNVTEGSGDKWKILSALLISTTTSLPTPEHNQNHNQNYNQLLLDNLIISHHPSLSPPSPKTIKNPNTNAHTNTNTNTHKSKSKATTRNIWIEMTLRLGVDPLSFVQQFAGLCMKKILEASIGSGGGFAEAGYSAVQTLLLVCPERMTPLLRAQLQADLDVGGSSSSSKSVGGRLSEQEMEIWRWNPVEQDGTPYIDVLAKEKKKADQFPKKGKDAAMAKWEAETRASLSSKSKASAASSSSSSATAAGKSKTGATSTKRKLTHAEQQQMTAQLVKESEIRKRVDQVLVNLQRGFDIIQAIARTCADVEGGGGGVIIGGEDVRVICDLIVGVCGTGIAKEFGGEKIVGAWLDLANLLTSRLEPSERWFIGMAVLRASLPSDSEVIPEEMRVENLRHLVLRTLYRLHFLSSTSPLDPYSFGFIWRLVCGCLEGSVTFPAAIPEPEDNSNEVDIEELPKLALEMVKFHSSDFQHATYPHLPLLKSLLHILSISNPNSEIGKDSSGVIRDLGVGVSELQAQQEEEENEEGGEGAGDGEDGVKQFIGTLFKATLVEESFVRGVVLQTLEPFDLTTHSFVPELWIACQDVANEKNQLLAKKIWDENGMDVPAEQEEDDGQWIESMVGYLDHAVLYVRQASALGIAEILQDGWSDDAIERVIKRLEEEYREKAKILAPEFDEYGMVIASTLDRVDPFPTRIAIGETFAYLTRIFPISHLPAFFQFLISDGPLGDSHPDVRRAMLGAATSTIDMWGKQTLTDLVPMFESYLASPQQGSGEASDHVREAVVILIGRAARHLEPGDVRLPVIIDRLVDALKTPAEQVQIAVSECLSPLSRSMPDKVPSLVEGLFQTLFEAPKYAERRGAAYGLAGVIKGIGISGMKKYKVLERLKHGAEEKKSYEPRQGTMFAFECLSSTLGRVFEPYVMYILPLLLSSFGDDIPDVREAGGDASKVIMANMSGYGVKLILPTLLSGLEEKQWRSKKGSIELLGMMAYCSPRQLSLSLPVVIPRLTEVLTDSHTKVRDSANKSLKMFGEVITNPEIQSLVPSLLKALVDPSRTGKALAGLLKMSFMHYIDHSSLALIIPIIERGLRERGADTKKKAAQIVGNLASLTDSKDFTPYLTNLLPMVHTVLVDPVPEARATAAKALGTLVERLGEHHFPNLVPGLLRTLKTDTSGVDRQGAAQGLSEVLAGLGMERLEGLLPDIIANAQSPRPTVREGFMSLLVYLPATFGTRFQPHLPKIISPILSGLADSEEYVRDAAMRAGRMVVTNYSNRAIDLLLPELERGMFDPGWRIRQSSITLVGELLFKISGISGKTSDLEEEDVGAESTTGEASKRALVEVLGQERRDHILAALYLVRQDGVSTVRQSSIQIWKALVYNTPKTVRELLPELLTQVLSLISSSDYEPQETAAKTVAELCRKFGEKIVAQMIPILQEKSTSSDPRAREGVCLVICEIMDNTVDNQREDYENDIINIVRQSLVDDEPSVRSAAARAFDTLQEYIGTAAIDQTIPTLLEALRQPGQSSGTALQALKEVMNVRASTVFPVLIPTLTAIPMTVFNARALASMVSVAGSALSRRLSSILNPLVKVVEMEKDDEELEDAVDDAIKAIMSSIDDVEGLNTLMLTLLGWAKHDSPKRRVSALQFFGVFCQVAELDDSLYRIDWIRQLVSSLEDSQVGVHTEALKTLEVFVKSIPKDELEPLVVYLRRSIESTGAPGQYVPGFSLPKGVASFVPIIIAGLTTGTHEQREHAAYAIGDLVERTEESSIKPFIVPFTGPLIRVATQATTLPPGVKTAILTSLSTMLERIPQFVKPFFPQLQRTFVKSAGDTSSLAVRNKAAHALGMLMKHQPRVDPVVTELVNSSRVHLDDGDESIASSLVSALAQVAVNAAHNISEPVRASCFELIEEAFMSSRDETYNQAIASLVSGFSSIPELVLPLINNYLIGGTTASALSSQTILAILEDAQDEERDSVFKELGVLREVGQKIVESVGSDRVNIGKPAREARDILKELDDSSLVGILR